MKIFGVDLRPWYPWKGHLIKLRAAYRLRIWWRLKLPQAICEMLGRHVWEPTIDWSHSGRICARCLKKVVDQRWDAKGNYL